MTKGSRYDVVVAGGGTAGIAAALAAARTGAKTLLLERYGFLGGMATAGMVGTVCGLYLTRSEGSPERLKTGSPERLKTGSPERLKTGSPERPKAGSPERPKTGSRERPNAGLPERLNAGLVGEIADRIEALPGSGPPLRRGRTFVVPYLPHELAALADDLTGAEPTLDVRLHAYLMEVGVDGDAVTHVRFGSVAGVSEVECGALVDASGDAIAALAAGAAVESPAHAERQLCSLVFTLQGVATGALGGGAGLAILRRVAGAEATGVLPPGSSDLGWRPTTRPGEVVAKLALRALDVAPEGDWLSAAERAGRRRVAALAAFLRREVPAFADAFVSHTAAQVGVRESRRIVGRHRLTRAEVLGGRRAADGIARAAWPIELWREGTAGASYEYLADGDWYDVPIGCLRATATRNLLAAGRCISGDSDALGSARVIGTCLATGAAAGREAAGIAVS